MSEQNNKPTYELKLLDTSTQDYTKVGVAWSRDDGSLRIQLGPGVVLSYENMRGKILSAFKPRTKEEWAEWRQNRPDKSTSGPASPEGE